MLPFRHSRSILLALLPFLLAIGIGLFLGKDHFQLNSSAQIVLKADSRNAETFGKVDELIPSQTKFVVLASCKDWVSAAGTELNLEMSRSLAEIPNVVEIKSLTMSGRPVIPDETRVQLGREVDRLKKNLATYLFNPMQLIEDVRALQGVMDIRIEPFLAVGQPDADWESIRNLLATYPLARNVFLSEDSKDTAFLVFAEANYDTLLEKQGLSDAIRAAIAPHETHLTQWEMLGMPLAEAEILGAMHKQIATYLICFLICVLLALLIAFRSVSILALILLFQLVGAGGLALAFYLFDTEPNFFTVLLLPLVSGLQLTFLTHYFSALRKCLSDENTGSENSQPLHHAFSEVFRASAYAAGTTTVGLLTLLVSDISVIKQFGSIGALAVLLVFVLTFVPLGLARLTERTQVTKSGSVKPETEPLAWMQRISRPLILGLASFFVLAAIPAFFFLRTDIRAKEYLPKDSHTRRAIELIDGRLGGMNIFQLKIASNVDQGMQSQEVLQYLERLRKQARELPGVSDAYSYSQIYTVLNEQLNPKVTDFDTLPDMISHQFISSIVNAGSFMFKDSFTDADARWAIFILRTKDMPASEYLALVRGFEAMAMEDKPNTIVVESLQGLESILEADRAMVRSLLISLGLCLFVFFFILAFLWRSARLSACVLLANLVPLAVILITMALLQYPLNAITVMISAIILGIAVDDGIHFVTFYKDHYHEFSDRRQLLSFVLRHKLRPMVCTTVILMAALSLLAIFSFPPVRHFGFVSGIALLGALASAVFVLPALLHRLGTLTRSS